MNPFNLRTTPPRVYLDVDYLCVTGGSGKTRVYLDELPQWLKDRPGHMIIRLEVLR